MTEGAWTKEDKWRVAGTIKDAIETYGFTTMDIAEEVLKALHYRRAPDLGEVLEQLKAVTRDMAIALEQRTQGGWTQEDYDVAHEAMEQFRKSGGDWRDKPFHAAAACLDAVAYRLASPPVEPPDELEAKPFVLSDDEREYIVALRSCVTLPPTQPVDGSAAPTEPDPVRELLEEMRTIERAHPMHMANLAVWADRIEAALAARDAGEKP